MVTAKKSQNKARHIVEDLDSGMLQAETAGLGGQESASTIAPRYKRHRPEQTLLYQIVEQHCSSFTKRIFDRLSMIWRSPGIRQNRDLGICKQ
jgi:hypothetical protein